MHSLFPITEPPLVLISIVNKHKQLIACYIYIYISRYIFIPAYLSIFIPIFMYQANDFKCIYSVYNPVFSCFYLDINQRPSRSQNLIVLRTLFRTPTYNLLLRQRFFGRLEILDWWSCCWSSITIPNAEKSGALCMFIYCCDHNLNLSKNCPLNFYNKLA